VLPLVMSAKPDNKVESRIYAGWVQFEAVGGPKFMSFGDDV